MKKKGITIEPSELIEFLHQELHNLPDKRKGSNTKYKVNDAVRAAFSVFFTHSPSFLEHQSLMKQKKGQDNAQHGGWIWSGDPTIPHRQIKPSFDFP